MQPLCHQKRDISDYLFQNSSIFLNAFWPPGAHTGPKNLQSIDTQPINSNLY